MNGHELAEALEVTPELLYGWARLGYLHPFRAGHHRYSRYAFRPDDVVTAKKMVALTNAGLTPRAAHAVARGDPGSIAALVAVFDGATLEPVLEPLLGDDDEAELALRDAMDIAVAVRDADPRDVWADLAARLQDAPHRMLAALVALAALVPVETPVSELLAWTESLSNEPEVA